VGPRSPRRARTAPHLLPAGAPTCPTPPNHLPTHPPTHPTAQLEGPDRELQAALAALNEARRRRTLLLGFSQDPAAFVDAAMAAQVPARC
jgi:hypothetical protein